MKKQLRRPLALFVSLAALAVGVVGIAPASASPEVGGRYIVTFRDGIDPDAEAQRIRGAGMRVERVFHHAISGAVVELKPGQVAALRRDPRVALVEADTTVTVARDTQNSAPWGLDRTDQRSLPLDRTYSYATTAAGVRIYVVDTGVRATHVDLAGRVDAGHTVINDGVGSGDCNGHGTHVAGTAAGTIWGMAKGATVVPVRVLNCTGSGSVSGVIAGLDWIAAHHPGGPGVVNMSLSGGISTTLDAAVNRVVNAGLPVVAAAGNNSGANACNYSPGRVPAAITVGATTSNDARANYSNIGSCLDLFAPGSSITSAWHTSDTATSSISGTSMASPHVAGAVALLLAQEVAQTPAQVAAALVGAATPNKVGNAGSGTPNRLLYVDPGPEVLLPVTVTTTALPSGTTGTSYSATLAASGGTGSYTWSLADGPLPAGLSLSGAGLIGGTPTAAGSFTFTARATDTQPVEATQTLTIDIVQAVVPTPNAFNKSRPSNGATGQAFTNLKFTWGKSKNLTGYEICISAIADCDTASTGWINVGTATTYVAARLNPFTTHYWQVRAVNAGGATEANAGVWWRFTTKK